MTINSIEVFSFLSLANPPTPTSSLYCYFSRHHLCLLATSSLSPTHFKQIYFPPLSTTFHHSGAGVLFGNDTLSVCKACDLKISEIVIFLNQDREHMQQGIFPDVQQSFLLHSALNFDEVSCKALVGAPLKANEFLKVEQTHLADIIAEEVGNEHLRMQEGAPASPHPKKTDEVCVVIP